MPLDLAQLWHDMPWICFDTETTGVDTKRAQVVQLGAVRFERGQVVDRLVTYCKPRDPIPPTATAIHGITDAMVADAQPVEAYAGELARLGADALPVAYNQGYDRRILHRYFVGTAVPAWGMPVWVCPLVIVRDVERVVEGKGYYKLASTCARWGVELGQAHDAGADAEAAGALLWKLHEQAKIRSCPAWKLLRGVQLRGDAQEASRAW